MIDLSANQQPAHPVPFAVREWSHAQHFANSLDNGRASITSMDEPSMEVDAPQATLWGLARSECVLTCGGQ